MTSLSESHPQFGHDAGVKMDPMEAVPSPVHTMWIVRVVSDFVEDEFVEVWAERPLEARSAVMQMLRRRRDDHASMVVGVIDSGLRDS
jgi:hypothetical protein